MTEVPRSPNQRPPNGTLLTEGEKDAIRDSACALCLAQPPFPDGSRCHPHRIIRGRDGGQYVEGNVIPLCPPCHREIDRIVMITAALKGGRTRAASLTPDHQAMASRHGAAQGGRRVHQVHPNLAREIGRKGGLARAALLSPAERSAAARHATASLTPAQRAANGQRGAAKGASKGGQTAQAKRTPEQRAAWARAAGQKSAAARLARQEAQ